MKRVARVGVGAAVVAIGCAAALAAASPARAETCGYRSMTATVRIAQPTFVKWVDSTYKIRVAVCWNGHRSWAASPTEPTVTYSGVAPATDLRKGNYLMSDGRTTDFWVNFRYRLQCTTFPFMVVDQYWYPRIKVGPSGGTTYDPGEAYDVCFPMWSWINSTT